MGFVQVWALEMADSCCHWGGAKGMGRPTGDSAGPGHNHEGSSVSAPEGPVSRAALRTHQTLHPGTREVLCFQCQGCWSILIKDQEVNLMTKPDTSASSVKEHADTGNPLETRL